LGPREGDREGGEGRGNWGGGEENDRGEGKGRGVEVMKNSYFRP